MSLDRDDVMVGDDDTGDDYDDVIMPYSTGSATASMKNAIRIINRYLPLPLIVKAIFGYPDAMIECIQVCGLWFKVFRKCNQYATEVFTSPNSLADLIKSSSQFQ